MSELLNHPSLLAIYRVEYSATESRTAESKVLYSFIVALYCAAYTTFFAINPKSEITPPGRLACQVFSALSRNWQFPKWKSSQKH
jgi:hypothetical protein